MKQNCIHCNGVFIIKPYEIKNGNGKYCSVSCMSDAFKKSMIGENNPNYKNARNLCIGCGNKVKSYSTKTKYCSRECYFIYKKMIFGKLREEKIALQKEQSENKKQNAKYKKDSCRLNYSVCQKCKITFSHQNKTHVKHCKKCHRVWQNNYLKSLNDRHKPVYSTCLNCSKLFKISPSSIKYNRGKFCSAQCRSSGKFNVNYKGGVTSEGSKIRNSEAYKSWRKSVFERDNYMCQWCNQTGGELHADHIKQFAFYPELRFDISNGRILCKNCHKKTETYLKGRTKTGSLEKILK